MYPTRRTLLGVARLAPAALASAALAGSVDRAAVIAGWRRRIESFLQRGIVPIIDTEFTYGPSIDLAFVAEEMDRAGVAQICLAPGDRQTSDFSIAAFRRYPDRFVPTTKDGSSPEWYAHRSDFAATLARDLSTSDYFLMGEFELRRRLRGMLDGGAEQRFFGLLCGRIRRTRAFQRQFLLGRLGRRGEGGSALVCLPLRLILLASALRCKVRAMLEARLLLAPQSLRVRLGGRQSRRRCAYKQTPPRP